jgi:hypothetical protein
VIASAYWWRMSESVITMVRPLLGERLASPAGHEAGVAEAAPRPLPRCDLEPGQGGPRPFAHAAPVEATDCGVAWSLIRARAGKPLPGDLDLEPGAFELGDLIAVQRERRGRATCSARARRSSGSTAPGRVAAEQVPGLEPRDVVVDVAARAETPACASAAARCGACSSPTRHYAADLAEHRLHRRYDTIVRGHHRHSCSRSAALADASKDGDANDSSEFVMPAIHRTS